MTYTDAQKAAWVADGGEIDVDGHAVWTAVQCDRIREAADPHAEIARSQALLGIAKENECPTS